MNALFEDSSDTVLPIPLAADPVGGAKFSFTEEEFDERVAKAVAAALAAKEGAPAEPVVPKPSAAVAPKLALPVMKPVFTILDAPREKGNYCYEVFRACFPCCFDTPAKPSIPEIVEFAKQKRKELAASLPAMEQVYNEKSAEVQKLGNEIKAVKKRMKELEELSKRPGDKQLKDPYVTGTIQPELEEERARQILALAKARDAEEKQKEKAAQAAKLRPVAVGPLGMSSARVSHPYVMDFSGPFSNLGVRFQEVEEGDEKTSLLRPAQAARGGARQQSSLFQQINAQLEQLVLSDDPNDGGYDANSATHFRNVLGQFDEQSQNLIITNFTEDLKTAYDHFFPATQMRRRRVVQ